MHMVRGTITVPRNGPKSTRAKPEPVDLRCLPNHTRSGSRVCCGYVMRHTAADPPTAITYLRVSETLLRIALDLCETAIHTPGGCEWRLVYVNTPYRQTNVL